MSPPMTETKVETKAEAEALIPLFQFERILNQDQNGRRITLLGTIKGQQAILTLERAAFPSDAAVISSFLTALTNTNNLGANDVYRWYMSSHTPTITPSTPDLKLNLIYPCTPQHIRKYTVQTLRYVTETPTTYLTHIRPWIERTQRTPARLDWIHNILDGTSEQDDIVYRSPDHSLPTGFLLLPDLNWDRRTLHSLHLLALVQRRDLTSLRDLRVTDLPWLRTTLAQIRTATALHGSSLSSTPMTPDQVKCYVHYQPTYYHFHVHVVHVMSEPEGNTQSVGKAFGLEGLIALLEALALDKTEGKVRGLDEVDLTYFLGEESDLWKRCFGPLGEGGVPDLLGEV